MTDPSGGGLIFQQKILNHIKLLTVEVNHIRDLVHTGNDEKDKTREITGSLHRIFELSSQLEIDTNYFFELSNSQHLMLTDNLLYIRTLEQELKELKL